MRQYSLYITFLLSLLLPLHAAASVWLSAPICPMQTAMAEATDQTAKNAAEKIVFEKAGAEKVAPNCCDDMEDMDCPEMQTCYGCNISCHLFSFSIPVFTFSLDANIHPTFNTPTLELFDPASVWRPPTNS